MRAEEGSKGDADIKNRLLDSVGESEGGMICENSIETYTLPYVKQTASGNLMYDAGNQKSVLCDNLEGGVGWGGVGREVGDSLGGREHKSAYGQFMLMYGKNHHNIVK